MMKLKLNEVFPVAALTVAATLALTLVGCGKNTAEDSSQAKTPNANKQVETPEVAALPASLFLDEIPDGAKTLFEAKSSATEGDTIVLQARIGGRKEPFVASKAIFVVADPALKSCDQIHGDTCKTPWDYCCEDRESLVRNTATIQIVDADGKPLDLSVKGEHGLEELKTVYVIGTVSQMDEGGTMVVDAKGIHVKGA